MHRSFLHIMKIVLTIILIIIVNKAHYAQTGRILLEYWDNMNGSPISALTSSNNYPNRPSGRMFPEILESPQNIGDNYGTRIRGYVHPPSSGNYTFWIAGDDQCELWLSTDENPANKKLVASSQVYTGSRAWTKSPSQKSSFINLGAGKSYYIEVLHKENTGNDNLAVGWTLPNGTQERPIPGNRLSPFETVNTLPLETDMTKLLVTAHPRLQATSRDFTAMQSNILTNGSVAGIWHKTIKAQGGSILSLPVNTYNKPDGTLLNVSRDVLNRIIILTYLCNTDTNKIAAKNYATRAWNELASAASFPDWNPGHFLDVSEMTYAFALGYDRLYSFLNSTQRTTLRNAIIDKGFVPFINAYDKGDWWTTTDNNWNIVCNSGVAVAALCIGDEAATQSNTVLSLACASLKKYSNNSFAPDGGFAEGAMYWGYSVQYLTAFLSSLETSQGTDFGFGETSGLAVTGTFPMYLTSPVKQVFNYSDCGSSISNGSNAAMFYLARKYNKHEYTWFQRDFAKGVSPYNIIWYDSTHISPDDVKYPTSKVFDKVGVVSIRNDWSDPSGVYTAFKAGNNAANHSNLDNGDFVYDALGYRWAMDLGGENYSLPGIFGNQRWTYYRLMTEGQNTLVINPAINPNQESDAIGTISSTNLNSQDPGAVLDISSAYATQANKVLRAFKLYDKKNLLIQDDISVSSPVDLWWFMHTQATILLSSDKKTATLTQGTKRVIAKIASGPSGATFSVMEAQPLPTSPNPAGQNPNVGIKKLTIHVKNASSTSLAVLLMPLNETELIPSVLPKILSIDGSDVVTLTHGTEDVSENLWQAYPNPARDKLTIVLPINESDGFVTITDMYSKVILEQKISSSISENTIECNVSEYIPGSYFLKFSTPERTYVKKVIIAR